MTVNFRKLLKVNQTIHRKRWEVKKSLVKIGLIWNVKLLKKIVNVNEIHDRNITKAATKVPAILTGKKLNSEEFEEMILI